MSPRSRSCAPRLAPCEQQPPGPDHQRLLQMVEVLYAAVADDRPWSDPLAQIVLLLEAQAAAVWRLAAGGKPEPLGCAGIPRCVSSDRQPCQVRAPGRRPCVAAAVEAPSEGAQIAFGVCRPSSPLSAAERACVEHLLAHFSTAVVLRQRLLNAERQRLAATAALDRLWVGAITVDGDGRVVSANRVARRLARQTDGLALDQGRVRAGSVRDTLRLRIAIAQVARDRARAPVALRLQRPSRRTPLEAVVLRAPRSRGATALMVTAVVFVTDPEERPRQLPALLSELHALTPAEAKLVNQLLKLRALPEAAEALGVSRHTASTHLHRVFAKTDCHSQVALTARLLTGPATLTTEESSGHHPILRRDERGPDSDSTGGGES